MTTSFVKPSHQLALLNNYVLNIYKDAQGKGCLGEIVESPHRDKIVYGSFDLARPTLRDAELAIKRNLKEAIENAEDPDLLDDIRFAINLFP